jgi:hypothetical protein
MTFGAAALLAAGVALALFHTECPSEDILNRWNHL